MLSGQDGWFLTATDAANLAHVSRVKLRHVRSSSSTTPPGVLLLMSSPAGNDARFGPDTVELFGEDAARFRELIGAPV
jgi:hypothetical protein